MALHWRVSIACSVLVAIGTLVASVWVYASQKEAQFERLNTRIETRFGWLLSSLELDDDEFEFEPGREFAEMAPYWFVETQDGRELWRTQDAPSGTSRMVASRRVTLGSGPEISGDQIRGPKSGYKPFGKKEWAKFRVPENGMVQVVIRAEVPDSDVRESLTYLRSALFVGCPLFVGLIAMSMFLIVRGSTSPLRQLATAARAKTPDTLSDPVDVHGGGAECVALVSALNEAFARIGIALDRERNFSASAAHELRTPLAQLRTRIEVGARRDRSPDEYKEILNEAGVDIERLQALMDALLALARVDAASGRVDCSEVSLDGIRDRIETQFSDAGLKVEGDWSGAVTANEELLVTSIRNLVDNALAYGGEEPPAVSCSSDDGVRITVTDSGPGIPEADRERIFEPLVRLDDARTIETTDSGFGLGLSVARAAVRAMGGELTCANADHGQAGAVFTIRFA